MSTFVFVGANDASPSTFIGSTTGSGGTLTFHANAADGDIAIVYGWGDSSPGTMVAGWTNGTVLVGTSLRQRAHWKVLTAGDIATPPARASSVDNWEVLIYRGGANVAEVSSIVNDSGSTADIPGVTKSASSRKLVTAGFDTRSITTYTTAPTTPTGFTSRFNTTHGSFSRRFGADIDPSNYTDGATISWTGMNTSTDSNTAGLIEITT